MLPSFARQRDSKTLGGFIVIAWPIFQPHSGISSQYNGGVAAQMGQAGG
jgi:hypothetical protein